MAVNEFFLKIIKNTIKMRVFYPTGVREGIYCDLLAITTLNLVLILLLLLLLLNSDLSAPLLEKPFEITEIDQVRKIDHHERKCNRV